MDVAQASKWLPHFSQCPETKQRRAVFYQAIVDRYCTDHPSPESKLEMLVLCNWFPYAYSLESKLPTVASELSRLQLEDTEAAETFEQWGGDRADCLRLNGSFEECLNGTRLHDHRTPRPVRTGEQFTAYSHPVDYSHAYLRVLRWHSQQVLVKVGHSVRSVVTRYRQGVTRSDSGSVQTVPFMDVRGVVQREQRADLQKWVEQQTTCDQLSEAGRSYFRHQLDDPQWLELALLYIGQEFYTAVSGVEGVALRGRCEFLLMPVHVLPAFIAQSRRCHQLTGVVYSMDETRFLLDSGDSEYAAYVSLCPAV
jgi:hypothetical protein